MACIRFFFVLYWFALFLKFGPLPSKNARCAPAFGKLVKTLKARLIASPKLLNLNQDHLSKRVFFQVKPLQNWGYDNFSHRNARVTKVW